MTREEFASIGQDVPEVIERFAIKPIETMYAGIKFRSRLEARWAVFFDSLRLTWEYEPEGFDLGDGVLYLPDFWLGKMRCWIEIKGDDPNEDACDKASRLAEKTGFKVFVFFGGHTMPDSPTGPPKAYAFFPDGSADCGYLWCECRSCGLVGIQYEARSDRLPCKEPFLCAYYRKHGHFDSADVHRQECDCDKGCQRSEHGDKGRFDDSPSLVKAYGEARSMRFGR